MTHEERQVFDQVVTALRSHQELTRPIAATQDALAEATRLRQKMGNTDGPDFMGGYSAADLRAPDGFGDPS